MLACYHAPVTTRLLPRAGFPATTAAGLYIDIEYSLETLSPGHCGMALSRRTDLRIGDILCLIATVCRGDLSPPAVIGTGRAGPVSHGTG